MFNASSKLALALTVIAGISTSASAQGFVGMPMAGSVGAGNSAISGVPIGPANPGVRSDLSGVRNSVGMGALRSPSIRVPTVPHFH